MIGKRFLKTLAKKAGHSGKEISQEDYIAIFISKILY